MQQRVGGKAVCGLFGVEKAGKGCLRVIYDARLANRELEPREEQLLLFTLHELIDSFRQYRYVHTVDYRHYYYQFRIPFGLAVWFVIRLSTRCRWITKVLPMGFREAVVIAQTATWVIVLYHEKGEDPLGIDHKAVAELPEMPAFISLRQKGQEVGRIACPTHGTCPAPSRTARQGSRCLCPPRTH